MMRTWKDEVVDILKGLAFVALVAAASVGVGVVTHLMMWAFS